MGRSFFVGGLLFSLLLMGFIYIYIIGLVFLPFTLCVCILQLWPFILLSFVSLYIWWKNTIGLSTKQIRNQSFDSLQTLRSPLVCSAVFSIYLWMSLKIKMINNHIKNLVRSILFKWRCVIHQKKDLLG